MKTIYLKKAFAALAISVVAVSATSVSAFAADEIRGADNGFTADEIAASTIKPIVSVDKVTLSLAEAQEYVASGTPVEIKVTVSGGTDGLWAPTGIHYDYDQRLEIVKNRAGKAEVKQGDGGELLSVVTEMYTGGVFVTTSADGDFGYDGVLYTMKFNLPADVAEGDKYPIDLVYRSAPNAVDKFTNAKDDHTGQLMQGWVFTQGLDSGWIEIEGGTTTTTTTTTTTAPTTTTTTTSAPTTTTTTSAPTTTTTTTSAPTTTTTTTTSTTTTTTTTSTTTTTGTDSGTQPVSNADVTNTNTNTNTNTTTKTNTTTSAKNNNNSSTSSSPKTGVAGVGIAAAGLAVAIGTAFVLRKKND